MPQANPSLAGLVQVGSEQAATPTLPTTTGAEASAAGTVRSIARPVRAFGAREAASSGTATQPASVAASAPRETESRTVAIDSLERLFQSPEAERTSQRSTEASGGVAGATSTETGTVRSATTAPLAVVLGTDTSQRAREVAKENGALRVGVWNQLQRSVNDTVSSGKNAVVIELKPPHLGDVRVTITANEQAVVAHFEAQSHTVRATLESNMYLLKDMLTNAGLNPDRLEVTVGFGGAGDQGGWKQQQGQRDPGASYRTFDPRHSTETEELSSVRPIGTFGGNPYRASAVVDLLA